MENEIILGDSYKELDKADKEAERKEKEAWGK